MAIAAMATWGRVGQRWLPMMAAAAAVGCGDSSPVHAIDAAASDAAPTDAAPMPDSPPRPRTPVLGEEFAISDTAAAAVAFSGHDPAVASDGSGFLAVWVDGERGQCSPPCSGAIHATRLDASGQVLDPGGLAISYEELCKFDPAVAFDGTHYVVVWADRRDPSMDRDVYASRVAPDGTVLDPEGFAVASTANTQERPANRAPWPRPFALHLVWRKLASRLPRS